MFEFSQWLMRTVAGSFHGFRFSKWLQTQFRPTHQRSMGPIVSRLRSPRARLLLERLEDRTTPTTLVSVTANQPLTDATAGSTLVFTAVFSGSMNTSVVPLFTFPTAGEDPGTSLTAGPPGFFTQTIVANDTYIIPFNAFDQNVMIPNIDVRVSGGQDAALAAVPAATIPNVFSIDTLNPTVTAVTPSVTTIRDATVGTGTFTVAVTFSEAMSTLAGNTPVITFNPSIASTLTFASGAWNSPTNTVYTATYNVADADVNLTGITVSVSGARDAVLNPQQAFNNQPAGFVIDTQNATVTDAAISISGATGTGGAYRIGDVLTVTWSNVIDGNTDIASVTANVSQFGGTTITLTNTANVYSGTYTIVAGAIDAINRNVSVTATDNVGNTTTTADTTNASVDNIAPIVTDPFLTLSGTSSGTGGTYIAGDTVTMTWNNTVTGDNNADTIVSATVNFSEFGGGAAVPATNAAGTWTASFTILAGTIDSTTVNATVTATDNAGNTTTRADSPDVSLDNQAPIVTDGAISISGATGAGGTYRIGDVLTVVWSNLIDGNADTLASVIANVSQFGGTTLALTNAAGVYSGTYTIVAGTIDALNRNVSVTVTDNAGIATTTADTSNVSVDNIAPIVTDGAISISGATGTSGVYRIGDVLTVTWSNVIDGNADTLASVIADVSQFGGTTIALTNNAGVYSGAYTIVAGTIDAANRNVSVTVTDNASNVTTTADTTNASVDNIAPIVTDAFITLTGTPSGGGTTFIAGDTVTVSWNNTAAGDNNLDTINNATINFSEFGGGAAVAATNVGGIWSASYTIVAGTIDSTTVNASVTATDNAGNVTTRADSPDVTVDNQAPTVTDAAISISGATGAGGTVYRIGDVLTVTWNNITDGNADLAGVSANVSEFGGTTITLTNNAGVYTGTYTIVAGTIDATNRNVSVTATDNAGNATTTADTSNASVDNIAPIVTDGAISISGATGPGGVYRIGDVLTVSWSSVIDVNADTLASVTASVSQFGGTTISLTNTVGVYSGTYTIVAGTIDAINRNVSVTVTDNGGNATTTQDTSNASVDNIAPIVTDAAISISGATGAGGAYRIGDVLTVTWNNNTDNNTDVLTTVTADVNQFGGTTITLTNVGGVYSGTYTIVAGAIDAINRNVSVTATDNAGNVTTTADTTSASVDNIAPVVTDAAISISGATGAGGTVYRIGDVLTVTWNNNTDGNTDTLASVIANVSQFGGTTISLTNTAGVYTGNYTIVAGAIDATSRNVSVSVTDNASNVTTTADTTNASVDNIAPIVTDAFITLTGTANGVGGTYIAGDTVTITWNNTAVGDNNADTITSVTIDFSEFGGGAAVAATNTANSWSASFTILTGTIDSTTVNASVTATDNAGNLTTTADSPNVSVDNQAPTLTDAAISISGATGAGGTYRIGDVLTVTWNNVTDANADIATVTADVSQFGGTTITLTNNAGIYTGTYTIVAGTIDALNRNVTVTATDDAGIATTTADTSNASVDNIAPIVTDAAISISGATGTGGVYRIGDVLTVAWSNVIDGNTDTLTSVIADVSQFGGTTIALTNAAGIYTGTYTIVAGAIDATNRNVSVTVTDNASNATTRLDTTNASVDNIAPIVTDAFITLTGTASGAGGTYIVGDTVTVTWNNTAAGDNNADTISAVTVNFTEFGGGAAVAATNVGNVWSASYTIVAGAIDSTTVNATVTATDNAGNSTTTADSPDVSVDNQGPIVTDAAISISGATGAGGTVYRIGDVLTVTWNNNTDGNLDVTTVTANVSQFGGTTITLTNTAGIYTGTYTIVAGTINNVPNRNVSVTATDNAGNGTTRLDTSNATVDNVAPTVLTLAVSPVTLITDAENGTTFSVTVTYSEPMNPVGFNPTISFSPGVSSTLTLPSAGVWSVGNTVFTRTYTIVDAGVDVDAVDITVADAQDAGGNTQASFTGVNRFSIDTLNPTVVAILPSVTSITDASNGTTFSLTVQFSEPMDTVTPAFTPVISFPVENPGATLTFLGASWVGNSTYFALYQVSDVGVSVPNIDVRVTAGRDQPAHNLLVPSTVANVFSIDTLNPTVVSVAVSTPLISDSTTSFTVVTTYSEPMDPTVIPIVNFSPSINSTLTLNAGLSGWTSNVYTAVYSVTDANVNVSGIIASVTGGEDAAGNAQLVAGTSSAFAVDTLNPTVAVNIVASSLSDSVNTSNVTFTFSEAPVGFTDADITVVGGTLSPLVQDTPTTFHATFTATDGIATTGSVTVAAASYTDAALNLGSAGSDTVAIDTLNPTLTINIVAASLSDNPNTSNVTFTFSEAPVGFADGDITTVGGTLSALVQDTPTTYHATYTATDAISTTGSVSVAAGSYTDAALNLGGAGADTVTIDTLNPTLVVNIVATSLSDTGNTSNVTFTFSEAPVGFADGDITTVGGTLSTLVQDTPTTYHATFTATDGVESTGSVTVAAGSYTDAALNLGGLGADIVTIDTLNPTVTVNIVATSLSDSANTSNVSFTFSEAPLGFTDGDITTVGGTLSTLVQDSPTTYHATFTANDGIATLGSVTVTAGSYTDAALNLGSAGADTVAIDTLNPTLTVNIVAPSLSDSPNTSNVLFTFSEAPVGFADGDITTVGGTLSPLVMDTPTTYHATFTATDGAETTGSVSVAAGSYTDAALNLGGAGSDVVTIDTLNPTLAVDIVATSLNDGINTSNVTFTFSEAPVGFADGDITTVGGTLSALVQDTSTTYHATFTAANAFDGIGSVSVAAGSYTDAATNLGGAGSDTVTIDTLNPTLAINIVAASLSDSVSASLVTFTFSEAPVGFGDLDIATVGGTLSALVMDTPTTYHATFTANDGFEGTGSVSVAAGSYTDAVSNLGGAGSDSVAIDTLNPTVTVNIVAASMSDSINTSNVTFTFNEAPIGFTNADISTVGGTLSALVMDTPTTYHATFTATDGIEAIGSVSLAASSYTDAAGNLGSAGVDNVAIDTLNPTVLINIVATSLSDSANTSLVTFTFSEAPVGFTDADVTAVGGTLSPLVMVTPTTYQATLTATDAIETTGSVSIATGSYTDAALNLGTSWSDTVAIDTLNPTLTINIIATSLSDSANASTVTFTFSEAPLGFTDGDVTTVGGTLSTLIMDTPTIYHATFTATDGFNGTGSVSAAAGSYTDAVGNLGGAGSDSVVIDTQNPTVTVDIVASSLSDTVNTSNVTFTFSEAPLGFTNADITTVGGTLSALVQDTPTTYHATFTATDGTTATGSVSIAAGSYTDAVLNLGGAGTDSVTIDTLNPTVAINIVASALNDSVNSSNVTFVFSEAPVGFTDADITTVGGTLSPLVQDSPTTYHATFTATDGLNGTGSISVGAGSYTDAALNLGGAGTDSVSIDTLNPTLTINIVASTLSDIANTSNVTFTFSEAPIGFVDGDVVTVGGTLSPLVQATPTTYFATFTATDGLATTGSVSVAAGSYADAASNLGGAGTDSVVIDTLNPTVVVNIVASTLSDGVNASNVTFTFSEAPVGFTTGDITTVGGTLGALVQDTPTSYHATFTATDGFTGEGSVSVAAGSYTDAALNLGGAGSDTVSIDTQNPTVAVNIVASSLNDSVTDSLVTFTFSEAPVGFTDADITTVGGTLSPLVQDTPTTYHATFSATDNLAGLGSVSVTAGSYTDAALNLGDAGTDSVVIDTQNPTAIVVAGPPILIADSTTSFVITVTYSEAMNQSINPVIAFSTPPSGLSLLSLGWTDATTFVATYNVTDANVNIPSITATANFARDVVGNVQTPSAPSNVFSIDTLNPTLAVNIVGTLLTDGSPTSNVTFTFSEAPLGFTDADITVVGGTLSALVQDTPTTYHATFTAPDGSTTPGSVSVAASSYTDAALNLGGAASDTVAIDTVNPTLTVNIAAASLNDNGNTSNVAFTFSEPPVGFASGDITVVGGTLSPLVQDTPTTYHATFTATDGIETTGSVSVAAGSYTDAALNLGGAGSDSVSIDTLNPTVVSVLPSTTLINDSTAAFTITVTYDGVMNTGTAPTIGFSPNLASTLSLASGSWNVGQTIYTANYTISDANVIVNNVTISVTGAQDVNGNTQTPFNLNNAFSVNTLTTTLPFVDTFSTGPNLNGSWTEQVGHFVTTSGQAVAQPGFNLATLKDINTADVTVQAQITFPTTPANSDSYIGLVARYSGPGDNNLYLGNISRIFNPANPSVPVFQAAIYRIFGGSAALLSVQNLTTSGNGTLRFDLQGSSLKLYLNGALIGYAQDSVITSGSVGMRVSGGTQVDNFAASTIAVTTALPYGPDTFTASAPGNQLGANWQEQAGNFNVSTNRAVGQAAFNLATLTNLSVANVAVQADINFTGDNQYLGLVGRHSGAGDMNEYIGNISRFSSTSYVASIYRIVNGAATQLAAAVLTSATGTLRFELVGPSLKLFLNNTLVAFAQDSTPTLATGSVGMRTSGGNATGPSFDNFAASAITSNAALPFVASFAPSATSQLNSDWIEQVGNYRTQLVAPAAVGQTGLNLAVVNGVSAANVTVEANVTLTANSYFGLLARYTGPGDTNGYLANVSRLADGTYQANLYKSVGGGAYTVIGTTAFRTTFAGNIRFVMNGSTLTLLMDNTLAVTVTDTSIIGAGTVGMRSGIGATVNSFIAS